MFDQGKQNACGFHTEQTQDLFYHPPPDCFLCGLCEQLFFGSLYSLATTGVF